MAQSEVIRNHAAFIWSVADLLRGDYKQSEYGRVILPMVVLRRPWRALSSGDSSRSRVTGSSDAAVLSIQIGVR